MKDLKYRFTVSDPVAERLTRIFNARVEDVQKQVASRDGDRAEVMHKARTTMKQLRALWRLVRPIIPAAVYRQNNTLLRDAAQRLSEARDTVVAAATVKELLAQADREAPRVAFAAVLEGLGKSEAEAAQSKQAQEKDLAAAMKALTGGQGNFRNLFIAPRDWQAIAPGFEQSYRTARKRLRRAADSGRDEDFHEWRKAVKYFFYQLQLIEPSWPARLSEIVKKLKKLEKSLGDDHDLVMLAARLSREPARYGGKDAVETARAQLARRQTRLRKKALKLGEKLFAPRPKGFLKKLAKHWREWRA